MDFKDITELFASGIPDDFNEINFIEKIKTFGITKLPEIFFFKDANGLTRGTARLIFASHAEALSFKKSVNYKEIKGKHLWLTWYLPEKNFKEPKYSRCNLFIKNIDSKVGPQELEDLFITAGSIFSLRINYDNKGKSKGYGYICYSSIEEAGNATKKFNGHKLNEVPLTVMEFLSSKERHPEGLVPNKNSLFLKNLDHKLTDQTLKELLLSYGEITHTKVLKSSPADAENKGVGFVCFKSSDNAEKALSQLNAKLTEASDNSIIASFALTKDQMRKEMKERNVYIKCIPLSIGDVELLQEMSKYGKVDNFKIFVDEKENLNGKGIIKVSKGFGFVCFEKSESAKKLIDDVMVKGKKIWNTNIYANLYETKQERRRKLIMATGGFPYPYRRMGQKPNDKDMQAGPMRWDSPFMPPMGHPFMPPFFMPPFPPMMYPPPQAQEPAAAAIASGPNKEALMKMELMQLGDILYPMIDEKDKINSSKITGMLLEMEKASVVDLIMNRKDLDKMIEEAKKVLNQKQSN